MSPRHQRRSEADGRVVVGLHPVRELLRAGGAIRSIEIAAGRTASPVLDEILDRARDAGVPVQEQDRSRLDDDAEGLVHQGIVARAPAFPYRDLDAVLDAIADEDPPFLVALDGVTDPHNLGSVARTAEALGVHGLLLPARRAAGVTPSAEKAAAGALAHLPVVQVTNLVRTLRSLGERRIWSVGLDAAGAQPLAGSPLLTEPLVLVVGSEGEGLARLSQVACDQLVTIPMQGHVGSLNASVAAAIAMYEIRRRRTP